MKLEISKDFEKSVLKIKNKEFSSSLKQIVLKILKAQSLDDVPNIKPLKGHKNYFRIRKGEYRIGFKYSNNTITLLFAGHRKDVYKNYL